MNRFLTSFVATAALAVAASPLRAQTDTIFTYQGTLNDAGSSASGDYAMRFLLYDALVEGNQIGSTVIIASQSVTDGLFTAELDYGADAFDNTGRWLAIVVNGTTLSPRQPITRAPYSIQTRGINVTESGFVGIGRTDKVTASEIFGIHRPGSLFGGMFVSTDENGRPFYGYDNDNESAYHFLDGATGDWKLFVDGIRMTVTDEGNVGIGTESPIAVLHVASSANFTIWGQGTESSGFSYGVHGTSESTSGHGVHGFASSASGANYGVSGSSQSTNGRGVDGTALAASGTTYGVRGTSYSTNGRGVDGWATAETGTTYGVRGVSNSPSGFDFYAAGAGTNYGASSSRRWKNNIVNIDNPIEKLAALRGVYFDWDEEHGGQYDIGMIAEEVGKVLPEIVNYEENGYDAIGMDYSKMTPLLVEAVNALRAEKDAEMVSLREMLREQRATHQIEIEALGVENAALRNRLAALEAAVRALALQDKGEEK
jgi:Chaperone of endosialidase